MRQLREGTIGIPSLMILGLALVAGIEHTTPPRFTSDERTQPPRITGERTTPPRITYGKYDKW